ncbi:hypothetical protein BJF86_15365 [Serinicoccus sp. CNJ-927]|uniref:hypothetical protein n=1 Tax=Serinicoccus sp. CNJ-927 TaxID=1904970 RepID=UPI00095F06DA|nr:hypothetical protein [Serinicoccus sp. CNJ-927]OLT42178.1 hypothetical protein BJF86_15365 [Serinicoccus sp. CNJ-927]
MTLTQLLIDTAVVGGVVLMTLLAVVPLWLEAAARADDTRTPTTAAAPSTSRSRGHRRPRPAHRIRAV